MKQAFPRYSFLGLFLTLVSLLLLPPFFGQNFAAIHKLVWSLSLLMGLWLVTHKHRTLLLGSLLACPGIVVNWQTLSTDANLLSLGYTSLSILFFLLILVHLLYFVVRAKRVSSELIFASLCAYLLIGLVWAHIYLMMELCSPGSFVLNEQLIQSFSELLRRFIYYSFVTLSTLGYGDIVPANHLSSSWAAMEAIMGQLYLTIIVARLMGLYIGIELSKSNSEDK